MNIVLLDRISFFIIWIYADVNFSLSGPGAMPYMVPGPGPGSPSQNKIRQHDEVCNNRFCTPVLYFTVCRLSSSGRRRFAGSTGWARTSPGSSLTATTRSGSRSDTATSGRLAGGPPPPPSTAAPRVSIGPGQCWLNSLLITWASSLSLLRGV